MHQVISFQQPFRSDVGEASPDYKLKILDAALKTCKVKVDCGVVVNHVKQIEKKTAKYFVRCTEIKKNTIAKDSGRIHMGQHVPKKTVTSHSRSPFPEGWKRRLRVQSFKFQALFCDRRGTFRQRRRRTDQTVKIGFRGQQKIRHGLPQPIRSVRKYQQGHWTQHL